MAEQFHGLASHSAGGAERDHEESLIKQGFLPPRKAVEIPKGTAYLFTLYKEIRFSVTEDNKLMPRDELTFSTLNEYKQAMRFDLSATECSVILRADSVFNKSTR